MFRYFLLLLVSIGIPSEAYSYNDKCYRFEKKTADNAITSVQYYFSQKGLPLGYDLFVQSYSKTNNLPIYSYCYHSELTECVFKDSTYSCQQSIESAWFRIWDVKEAEPYASGCDSVFEEKYANVMKYNCEKSSLLPVLKAEVGKVDTLTIPMGGKVPAVPQGYSSVDDCVWEYEILGLMSKVTLGVVGISIVVVLILVLIVIKMIQKSKSKALQNLNSSLISQHNTSSV